MKFIAISAALALLPFLTSARPQATTSTPLASPTATLTPTGPTYHLKSRVKAPTAGDPAPPARFNDLWLYASHTGAGENDPLFTSNYTYASYTVGFLNDTVEGAYSEFNLGNEFPYGFSLVYATYAIWGYVEINAGQGTDRGYTFVESDGAQILVVRNGTDEASEWGGWLVCDWWHSAPQLFWRYNYVTDETTPSSCADIDLVQVLTS